MKRLVPIETVKLNPENPRVIKDIKFMKLVRSLKDDDWMHKAKPLIIDENSVVLGGNMRLRAFMELGLKEVWVDDMDDWTDEQKKRFVVKDNLNYGEWDYDALAQEYDVFELDEMGMDLDPSMFETEDDQDTIPEATDDKFNDYTIYFANEQQMDIWYGFLKKIKNKFKDHDNVSDRVLRYIAEVYDDNKMSESEMVLKFVEYDAEEE